MLFRSFHHLLEEYRTVIVHDSIDKQTEEERYQDHANTEYLLIVPFYESDQYYYAQGDQRVRPVMQVEASDDIRAVPNQTGSLYRV